MTFPKVLRCIFLLGLTAALAAQAFAGPHYEVVRDWPALPEGTKLGMCAGGER